MAVIRLKRGTQAQVEAASLLDGEPAFASDDSKLVFISDGTNLHLAGKTLIDTLVNRPAAAHSGLLFYASDTGELFLDTGSAWVEVGGGGSISTGTSFPPSPDDGDLFWREDHEILYLWSDTAAAWIDVSTGSGPGSGSGGFVWEYVSGNTTAADGKGYMADSSGGAFTITLPSNPSLGHTVSVVDASSSFSTNNVTMGRNGNKIMGLDQDLVLDSDNDAIELIYSNSTNGWRIK